MSTAERNSLSWNGLQPGQAGLRDVVEKFGPPDAVTGLSNAEICSFCNDKVRVTFLHGATTIGKVWVSAEYEDKTSLPANLEEAEEMFGKLTADRIDRFSGAIYEGKGVRVCCEAYTDEQGLKWFEIYNL